MLFTLPVNGIALFMLTNHNHEFTQKAEKYCGE